jgi:signal transduction histidine kinase
MSETSMTDAGFYGSLREYVSESTNDAGLHCTVEIEIDSFDRTSMDAASRHELLMIVSELLTNTLRHSKARCVHFTVDARGSQTTITWSDDGVGLDPAGKRGNGLNNIQRRATRIGATVSVDSIPDNGTRFTITYPTIRG